MLGLAIHPKLGGDFMLPSTLGKPLDSIHLRGQVVLMTFGYTNCAEICPIGLMRLNDVIKALEQDIEQVTVIFVSFDSSNDLDHLAKYLHNFNPAIIGLTGNDAEIQHLTTAYGVIYPKQKEISGGASFNHNGYIYLLDQQGKVRALYQNRTSVDKITQDIRTLTSTKIK